MFYRVDTPKGHHYEMDGKRVPGVTTLLSGRPKPALVPWAAREVAEYVAGDREVVHRLADRFELINFLKAVPFGVRDKAASKGTEIHGFAERLVTGESVEVPESLVGHVESCARFLDDYRVDVERTLVEVTVGSYEHRYCGTVDGVGPLRGLPENSMWDYKTNRTKVYPETALQLAGYEGADVYLKGPEERPIEELKISSCYAVHIREDDYSVVPLARGREVFQKFLNAARVYHDMKTDKHLLGDPLTLGE